MPDWFPHFIGLGFVCAGIWYSFRLGFELYVYFSGRSVRGMAWEMVNRSPRSLYYSMFFWPWMIDAVLELSTDTKKKSSGRGRVDL